MSNALIVEIKEQIAFITINRPEARNAINIEMSEQLDNCWKELNENDDIRVAVITGAGDKAFCAGMDLKEVARLKKEGKEDVLKLVSDPFMQKMRQVKKPIIAAINGNVFAGGFLLSLNSDIRVAVEGTSYAITESKIGRGSPWAIPLLWMIPLGITMELTLTGEAVSAEKMLEVGFLNRLVKREELMPAATKIAERIRDNAPLSVMAAKASLLSGLDLGLKKGFAEAIKIHEIVYESEDAQEGPRAFAEKRKPVWKGR
mgnify:CR=1 FL=1|jgi:enoyl-CoA hydratase